MPKLNKLQLTAAIQNHLKAGYPEARQIDLQGEVDRFLDQMEAKLRVIRASRKELNEVVVPAQMHDFLCGSECDCCEIE